ncbi:MAG: baseplate J/gp47 family protein, partial [Clostridia bacterium]|nr:baseplate J/gp47 family protein [Clostridia bacterium]
MYLDKIKYLVKAYAPEIDIASEEKNAAYGISVAMSDMFEDTAKKLDEVNRLYRYELVKLLGVDRQEGGAAEGIVAITMKPELETLLHIRKGTELYCNNGNGSVIYTVKFDTTIKHNCLKRVVFSDAPEDKVAFLFPDEHQKMFFFDADIPTIPRRMTFRQPAFFIKGMTPYFSLTINCEDIETWLTLLSDADKAQWYYVEGSMKQAIKPHLMAQTLCFELPGEVSRKDLANGSLTSRETEDIPYIYVDLYNLGGLSAFLYEGVFFGGHHQLQPNRLIAKDLEVLGDGDFMFGETYSIYDSFYIGSTTCFSKKGAMGSVSFDVEYKRVFREEYVSESQVNYKFVMRDEEFETEDAVDIEIEEVIWEYFNGNSWKRLLFNREDELIFKQRKSKVQVSFVIPEDMARVFVNGEERHYVRCRIHKISNYAHLSGHFITPVVSNVEVAYDYGVDFEGIRPMRAELEIFDRYSSVCYSGSKNRVEFQRERDDTMAIYIGFEEALAIGANTLYFDVENPSGYSDVLDFSVLYDYHGDDFVDLRVLDNTDNLATSGLIILFLEDDMKRKTLFGQSCYWIKITKRCQSRNATPILVNRIIPNAVSVVQKEKKPSLYFKNYEPILNQTFELPDKHIFETEVFVNERGYLSTDDYKHLSYRGDLKNRYDSKGRILEEWVRWKAVRNFDNCGPYDRVYRVDSNNGILHFGDNRHGRILPTQREDVVEVSYSISNGASGNLESGMRLTTVESIPSVSEIMSVTSIQGGMAIETDQQLIDRGMEFFAHRDRMVSIRDIETIAKTKVPQILDAKCNRHSDGLSIVLMPMATSYDDFHFKIIDYKVKQLLKAYMGAEYVPIRILRAKELFIDVKAKLFIDDAIAGQHLVFEIKERLKDMIEAKNE